jgi:uncharacterized protein (TIGR02246 family)
MRKRMFVTLALSALAAAPALAQDEAAIRKAAADFVAAWNRHDAKAMAARFAEDGDIINPSAQAARGRAEIEKLFAGEQTTVMKGSTYVLAKADVRLLGPTTAVADWEGDITGMQGPQGEALPPFKHHVTIVYVKKGAEWLAAVARPYAFLPPPPAVR